MFQQRTPKPIKVTKLPKSKFRIEYDKKSQEDILPPVSNDNLVCLHHDGSRFFVTEVVGYTHNDRQPFFRRMFDVVLTYIKFGHLVEDNAVIAKKILDSHVELIHEKDNKYDANAIKVIFRLENSPQDGYHMGYISKDYNSKLIEFYGKELSNLKCIINKIEKIPANQTGKLRKNLYKISINIPNTIIKQKTSRLEFI